MFVAQVPATWRLASQTRTALLHGHGVTTEVLTNIDQTLVAVIEAARIAIWDILGGDEDIWQRNRRTPMNAARPAIAQARAVLKNAAIEQIPIGTPYPHVTLIDVEWTGAIEGNALRQSITAKVEVVDFAGEVDPSIQVDLMTFADPESKDARVASEVVSSTNQTDPTESE